MRASTQLLTIALSAAMVATAAAGPHEKARSAAPARAAAAPHYAAPARQYAAPRVSHYAAPRVSHYAAPRVSRHYTAPAFAQRMTPQHHRTHIAVAPRTMGEGFARSYRPNRMQFATMPRMMPRGHAMRKAAAFAGVTTAIASPLMLSREARAAGRYERGYRVQRVAVRPSRHVSYISGRVIGVNDREVVIQPPAGGEVPVRIAYVPTYRTVVTGQTVTIPVLYTGATYYAYQPQNVVPYVVNTFVPAYASYVPYAAPYYGTAMNPWDAQSYYTAYNGDTDDENFDGNAPQYPDCSTTYYGQNYNQYYFTHAQYDAYCGPAGDAYPAPGYVSYDQYQTYPQYQSYPDYSTYSSYNPYYTVRNTAIVSGLIVGKSGSNVIVLTDNLQPAIINVGQAEAFGNTSGPLQVGRPIVAAGFYDPTNTLVATTVQ